MVDDMGDWSHQMDAGGVTHSETTPLYVVVLTMDHGAVIRHWVCTIPAITRSGCLEHQMGAGIIN